MLTRCIRELVVTTLLVASSCGGFAADKVYEWRDETDEVNFSDSPPTQEGVKPAERTLDPGRSDNLTVERLKGMEKLSEEQQSAREKASAERKEALAKAREDERHCTQTRAKLTKLENASRVKTTGADGQQRFLEPSERADWIATAEREITKHCH